jgi:hypothetical protein
MDPLAEQVALPKAYGSPSKLLTWGPVDDLLTAAPRYWLATTRPDGRPHSVPVDGIWSGTALFFGGDEATVHIRNLRADPRAVAHLETGESPVIVEGFADWHRPGNDQATRLAQEAKAKYGYGSTRAYMSGVWRLRPVLVLAWTVLYEDATRFRFEPA